MCQTKEEAIKDWVKLAVNRVNKTGEVAVFWLGERAHDQVLIKMATEFLNDHEYNKDLIKFMAPAKAMR